jgi:hypothetical protein
MTTTDPTLAAGAAIERERLRLIMSLPEAVGREATALQIALNTSMAPIEVAALLAELPKRSPVNGERSCDTEIGLVLSRVPEAPNDGASQ